MVTKQGKEIYKGNIKSSVLSIIINHVIACYPKKYLW